MQRRLPPLNSLRAFESAARLLSFTRAADELSVTQSAVSHQVKALEDWAGIPSSAATAARWPSRRPPPNSCPQSRQPSTRSPSPAASSRRSIRARAG
ncbi:MAG: LysR family transcriptional regulator [Alphaproteobacteria bacterium]|nr:LysR family transcriptional regulator [Alphaproteobacteria bacterium]